MPPNEATPETSGGGVSRRTQVCTQTFTGAGFLLRGQFPRAGMEKLRPGLNEVSFPPRREDGGKTVSKRVTFEPRR